MSEDIKKTTVKNAAETKTAKPAATKAAAAKPAVKSEAKTDAAKPVTKPAAAAKPVAAKTSTVKAEAKPVAAKVSAAKPVAKPAAVKPAAKPAVKAAAKSKAIKRDPNAKQVKVTLIRSVIGGTKAQRATVEALGLRKLRQSRIHYDNPAIRGMIHKVQHLVTLEELK